MTGREGGEGRPGRESELDRRLLGGPRRWHRREVAAQAGVSQVASRKLWRALGFANVPDGVVAFTDADVDALTRVTRLVREGALDEATAIALARALGQSTDRLVSWQTEALLEHLAATGGAEPEQALERLALLVDDLEVLLVHAWRRHLAATVGWLAASPGDGDVATASPLTVGFADLVSYTRLSQRLEQRELGVLVQRFEGLAADVVTGGGGRVVKTVGDEVLFTADGPAAGALVALALSEQMAVDEVVPDVRVGLAHGQVLRSLGDVYGPTVNLASRLTGLAQPGTVLTDPGTGEHLARHPDLVLVPQRDRQVRGFGLMSTLLVARSGLQPRHVDAG